MTSIVPNQFPRTPNQLLQSLSSLFLVKNGEHIFSEFAKKSDLRMDFMLYTWVLWP